MVNFSCNLCGLEVKTTGVEELWKAFTHTHDIDVLRERYGDDIAQIYIDRLEREAKEAEEAKT